MKNVLFIGAFDKLDMLLYIAKILRVMGKKVIIIDSTTEQKGKYVVPMINPTKSYLTRFEEIDIAIGFESFEEIEEYIEQTENKKMYFDIALVNIDNMKGYEKFSTAETIKNYFVTSYDLYSIRKGLEVISRIKIPIELTRVIFSTEVNEEDSFYLEYIALGYKTKWNDKIINFPYDTKDIEVMIENQKTNKVRIKNLSQNYKDALEYLISDMFKNIDESLLHRTIKNLEKEG